MRTAEVTREFRDTTKRLAEEARMPEVKIRLQRLADHYERELAKLQEVESPPLAAKINNPSTRAIP